MIADGDFRQLAFLVMVALAAGGLVIAIFLPFLASGRSEARVKNMVDRRKLMPVENGIAGRRSDLSRETRRKQVQESIKQSEAREQKRKRVTLRMLIAQAGLNLSMTSFWGMSAIAGALFAVLAFFFGLPWFVAALSGFVGFFGLPRWYLGRLRKRRQEKFLHDLPDALDIMVRGLRSGLPLSDAIRVIATESGPPIGPEFSEVIEGQRVGITIEQGLERMYERIPVQEVSFLAIVLSIQSKTGGNLTEALSNLSKVLRDRRKMKGKIRSVSQEAKSSAAILGGLPVCVAAVLYFVNPEYLTPLWTTFPGKALLTLCAVLMLSGILVMRKMINFEV
jgi:tight adherence protein B